MVNEFSVLRLFDPEPYDISDMETLLDALSVACDPAMADYPRKKAMIDLLEARIWIGVQAKVIDDLTRHQIALGDTVSDMTKQMQLLRNVVNAQQKVLMRLATGKDQE